MRRQTKVLIAALTALVLLAALSLWLGKCVFVLRTIVVQGGSLDVETIAAAAGLAQGKSVWKLREEEVRAGINSLGRVYLDAYQLKLPDKLLLRVKERTPEAMLKCGEELLLLDGACCAIGAVEEAPDRDLIYLSGLEVSWAPGEILSDTEGRAALCREILGSLEERQAGMYVSEIDLSDPEDLRIITRSGILVLLGDSRGISEKLALMQAAVADLEGPGATGGTLRLIDGSLADYSPPCADKVQT